MTELIKATARRLHLCVTPTCGGRAEAPKTEETP